MISPSAAISSLALTTKISPLRSDLRGHGLGIAVRQQFVGRCVFVRLLRSASACALPRPSAIASAKFAKITVNQSQSEICSTKANDSPMRVGKNRSTVVTAAPTSVTNITGFFPMWTGLSFLKLSTIAGMTISGSNSDRLRAWTSTRVRRATACGLRVSSVVGISFPSHVRDEHLCSPFVFRASGPQHGEHKVRPCKPAAKYSQINCGQTFGSFSIPRSSGCWPAPIPSSLAASRTCSFGSASRRMSGTRT